MTSTKGILRDKLVTQFGYSEFKSLLQEEATKAIYEGKDVFIRTPSGYGKSVCYQLPSLLKKHSFAIVVSPTVEDAKSQVSYLQSKDISVCLLHCRTNGKIMKFIMSEMTKKRPKMKLLYVTSTQFNTSHFQAKLQSTKQGTLSYLVIDEAHCLSKNGHDFKPSYKELTKFRNKFPNIPIVAVTATANKEVETDIFGLLKMENPSKFLLPLHRSNLVYDMCITNILPDPLMHLKIFIEKSIPGNKDCGIIFCKDQDTAVGLARALKSDKLQVLCYNRAKINWNKVLDLLNSGRVDVVITTTNNLGFRIMMRSIRFIVHWYNAPNIGCYYQESGRAGHDGNISYCRIYYYFQEFLEFNRNISKSDSIISKFQSEVQFFTQTDRSELQITCRHAVISEYFQDPIKICKSRCDICIDKNAVIQNIFQYKSSCSIDSAINNSTKTILEKSNVLKSRDSERLVSVKQSHENVRDADILMDIEADQVSQNTDNLYCEYSSHFTPAISADIHLIEKDNMLNDNNTAIANENLRNSWGKNKPILDRKLKRLEHCKCPHSESAETTMKKIKNFLYKNEMSYKKDEMIAKPDMRKNSQLATMKSTNKNVLPTTTDIYLIEKVKEMCMDYNNMAVYDKSPQISDEKNKPVFNRKLTKSKYCKCPHSERAENTMKRIKNFLYKNEMSDEKFPSQKRCFGEHYSNKSDASSSDDSVVYIGEKNYTCEKRRKKC